MDHLLEVLRKISTMDLGNPYARYHSGKLLDSKINSIIEQRGAANEA